MLGYTGVEATVAFPMQVSDALGYVGVTAIYLVKEFGHAFSYLEFFVVCGWITAFAGAFLIGISTFYYLVYLPRTSVLSTLRFERKQAHHSTSVQPIDEKNSENVASLENLLPVVEEKSDMATRR